MKIEINKIDELLSGKLDGREIISINLEYTPPKIASSTILPTDFEKAKNIVWLMQRTIDEAERIKRTNTDKEN